MWCADPRRNIGHCLSALCGFWLPPSPPPDAEGFDGCRFWGKRGLMKLCTFSTVPEACNWGKCLRLQFPDLSRGESWDSVFWITQLCRRKWSGYFPSVADSLSWTISASQVCRFLGFPESVLVSFAKYNSRKGNFASVNLAHLWLWDDIHLFSLLIMVLYSSLNSLVRHWKLLSVMINWKHQSPPWK